MAAYRIVIAVLRYQRGSSVETDPGRSWSVRSLRWPPTMSRGWTVVMNGCGGALTILTASSGRHAGTG
jgi:hypothetical protein